jgi:predicted Zn-dependent peptidase
MNDRFTRPAPGAATPVRFPKIARAEIGNGLRVWTIPYGGIPVATATLVLSRGTADDPATSHGLASLTADLLDEGAGSRDAIALAEAFARIGTELEIDVGPDATTLSCSGLTRSLDTALELMADVVQRPRLLPADFDRVRELRVNRLRQLSQSAGALADRAYVAAVFGRHPYGHGSMGTTASLGAMTLDAARDHWRAHYGPAVATLIVVGDVVSGDIVAAAERAFGAWGVAPAASGSSGSAIVTDSRVLLVDRPGAPQSELRIGHVGPSRATPDYHALVVLNAVVGGQFTSRINRRLREEKGVTYGARTSFDFRRLAGSFSCDTSVQANATAEAVADVLAEFSAIGQELVSADELIAARASLTRGYVRSFETAGQVARAAIQLAVHGLPDDTFDRFVPAVESIAQPDVRRAAAMCVRPDEATVVVVGDAASCLAPLQALGRTVTTLVPEF